MRELNELESLKCEVEIRKSLCSSVMISLIKCKKFVGIGGDFRKLLRIELVRELYVLGSLKCELGIPNSLNSSSMIQIIMCENLLRNAELLRQIWMARYGEV